MKFIYSTDAHYWTRNPASRRDDYPAAIIRKLEQIKAYGAKFGVDFFLDGGDLIHQANLGIRGVNALLAALRGRRGPTYAIIGNHPIEKNNEEMWRPRSAFQTIELAFQLDKAHDRRGLTREPMFQFKAPTLYQILTAYGSIRMHHTQLVKEPVLWDHVLWKDYDAEGAMIVLCSDYHGYQGHEVVNGVHFIAPGAVCRNARGPDDMTRKPQCALVEVTDRGNIHVEFLELPHEPGTKVFRRAGTYAPEDVARDEDHLQECVAQLRKMADEGLGLSLEDTLKAVAQGLDVSEEAVRYALHVLEETDAG